jgi:hypothetical protein
MHASSVQTSSLYRKDELPSSSSRGLAQLSVQSAIPSFDESVVTLEDILNPRPFTNTLIEPSLSKRTKSI